MTLIHLLQVGLEKPITIIKSDADMTESSIPRLAGELWVSLIYLLASATLEKVKQAHSSLMVVIDDGDLIPN
jgi:hypothetical protein